MRRVELPIFWPPNEQLTREEADEYERHASHFWEEFYKKHKQGFFKDRHYLHREFPALLEGSPTVLEVGCGVGNTAVPLSETNPQASIFACDFSPTAVECLRQHPAYARGRITAFVADVTVHSLAERVPAPGADICTLVFVLSAISPDAMSSALRNVAGAMRPGGTVFVRDYAAGDMAEGRFTDGPRLKRLGESFFVRGDGTRAYYFSEDGLRSLFLGCGFRCSYVRVCERLMQNRALDVSLERRWIQGVFVLDDARSGLDRGDGQALKSSSPGQPDGAGCGAEWEVGEQLQAVEGGLGSLFNSEGTSEMVEREYEIEGAGRFAVRSLSRAAMHTTAHTGLLVWHAGPAFAECLAASPSLLEGKTVLELGCGSSPLCMLVALRSAARVVSTDGSADALQQMAANISLNASKVIVERARLRRLAWGDGTHIARLAAECPSGFDVVLGADVAYVAEFVPKLFRTARSLMREGGEARLVLCHLTRSVSEADILAMAEVAGLTAARAAFCNAAPLAGSPFRLLVFARAQPYDGGPRAPE